jgi:outer membrane immunogenic protein
MLHQSAIDAGRRNTQFRADGYCEVRSPRAAPDRRTTRAAAAAAAAPYKENIMRFLASFVACLALASTLAGPARAKDFNGPHIGVQMGWGHDDLRNPKTDLGRLTIDRSRDSFTGGIFAGYDREVASRFVLGAEAGFNLSANDKIETGAGTHLVAVDPRWSIDLTTRAGYLVTPSTLLYVRGGYANARIKTTIADPKGNLSGSENRDGWVVGGGIEHLITANLSTRLEYRYSDLGQGDGRFNRHRVLAGLAYRF